MNKLRHILLERKLIPRRSKDERIKNYRISLYKRIHNYIANGSKGDLDLEDLDFDIQFPENFVKVGGEFNLSYSTITELPKSLKYVGGDLLIDHSYITTLPEGLTVGGNVYAEYSAFSTIPKNVTVKGDFSASFTDLKHVDPSLKASTLEAKDTDFINDHWSDIDVLMEKYPNIDSWWY